tara:strand:- start:114 stop:422 length:309 start_codon:yes stop_codon:yes gene_type:complete
MLGVLVQHEVSDTLGPDSCLKHADMVCGGLGCVPRSLKLSLQGSSSLDPGCQVCDLGCEGGLLLSSLSRLLLCCLPSLDLLLESFLGDGCLSHLSPPLVLLA